MLRLALVTVMFGLATWALFRARMDVEVLAWIYPLFVVVYGIVFTMGIYFINRLIAKGPEGASIEPPEMHAPRSPISAAERAGREAVSQAR